MNDETRINDLIDRWEEMRDKGTPVMIEEVCADCPELAAEVRRRIEALGAMDSALGRPASEPDSTDEDRDRAGDDLFGGILGVLRATAVFRPRRCHDHGGLGVVFTADQEELGRTVALKRIRPDKLREKARRRFLREATLTARLQHPGIVPIYGLGEAEGGPFYTMPFIRGRTLQKAIDSFHGEGSPGRDPGARGLQFRGLLQQFIAVCNTMAYAQDQGVVHRDLKPANIMLGPYGETLVMDWGLAKRIDDEAASEDVGDAQSPSPSFGGVSATGEVLGTTQYMSPEQARGEPVDFASDVFSLGQILHAILTGETRREAAIVPLRRRDPRPPRPLEAICLKALAAKPEERYPSAQALGDDVTRWLADEPVTAWREPVTIRARRWVRRHRTAMAATGVALVAGLIGLGVVAVVQARANDRLERSHDETLRALAQSEESRKRAEAVSKFLVEVFRRPDPSQDGREVKAVAVLDRAGKRLEDESAGSPDIQGTLLSTLGLTYQGLGLYDRAARLYARALAVREATLGPDDPLTLKSCNDLAGAYYFNGQADKAAELVARTLEAQEARLGPDHPDTLASRNGLAVTYLAAGRFADAIRVQEATLALSEAKLGPRHVQTLKTRTNLANIYRSSGQLPRAIPHFEATAEGFEAVLGPDDPETLKSRYNLAAAYRESGRLSRAIELQERTLARYEAKLGPDHPDTLRCRNGLAAAYQSAGRQGRAMELFEATWKGRKSALVPNHPDTLRSLDILVDAYREAGRFSEAIELGKEAFRLYADTLGPQHADTLESANNLANALQEAGELTEAIARHEATLALREAQLEPDHLDTLASRFNLASAYAAAGRMSEAIARQEATLRRMEAKLGPDHAYTLECRGALAGGYEALGRWTEAESMYREVVDRRRKLTQSDSPILAANLAALGRNLLRQSRWSEAEPLLREAAAIREKATPDDWSRYNAMSLLGEALLGRGKYAEAESLVVDGFEGLDAREERIPVPERLRVREAAERVVHLYEAYDQPEKAAAWKAKVKMLDLPGDVFAGP